MLTPSDLSAQTRENLTKFFSQERPASIIAVCEQAESELLKFLLSALTSAIEFTAENEKLRFIRISDEQFDYNGNIFEIRITEHESKPDVLFVIVQSVDPKRSRLIRKPNAVRLDSNGRYSEVRLKTAERLLSQQESLATVIKVVLESGYRWLTESVQLALDSLEDRAAYLLYSHLRQIFAPKVVDNIWLYAIVDERGIYIPDRSARELAFERATKRVLTTGKSPLEVMVGFSTVILDLDDLFSKTAIRENRTILGEVEKAPYADSGIQIAEEIIMELDKMIVQPLVREGRTLLVAGYPTELRLDVEPVLARERERLRAIIERGAGALRQLVRAAEQHRLELGIDERSYLERLTENTKWMKLKPRIPFTGVELDGNYIIGKAATFWREWRNRNKA